MKQLTIEHRNKNEINDSLINNFETMFNVKFPTLLVEFLRLYSGSSILENTYTNKETGGYYTVSYICELYSEFNPSIDKLVKGNDFYNYYDWIPFAIDPGGWVFNISTSKDKKGQIWVNKFDSGDENSFEFVTDTFEEFINGLRTEEEAFS